MQTYEDAEGKNRTALNIVQRASETTPRLPGGRIIFVSADMHARHN